MLFEYPLVLAKFGLKLSAVGTYGPWMQETAKGHQVLFSIFVAGSYIVKYTLFIEPVVSLLLA